jgi:hypothetical protein
MPLTSFLLNLLWNSRADYTGHDDLGTGVLGLLGNIIWLVLAGWWLALAHLITAFLLAITAGGGLSIAPGGGLSIGPGGGQSIVPGGGQSIGPGGGQALDRDKSIGLDPDTLRPYPQ